MSSPPTVRRHHPVSLQQAAEEAPSLARLAGLVRESGDRFRAIEGLLPPSLRAAVRPGPIEGGTWCLLVDSNAAAAKVRQLLPVLQRSLNSRGHEVTAIRVKVGSLQK